MSFFKTFIFTSFVKIGSLVLADGVTSCIQCFNCPGSEYNGYTIFLSIAYFCFFFSLEQFEEGTKGQSCGAGLDTCMVLLFC